MSAPDALRVLVTDGNSRAALAVTRSLGRAGFHVVVGDGRPGALAQASRYCAESVVYPEPGRDETAYRDGLIELVHARRIDVLLPVSEISTIVATESRQALGTRCRLPFPDAATLSLAADKAAIMQLAAQLGVPTPTTLLLSSAADLDRDRLPQYPVVVKPHRSRVRSGGRWASSTEVRYAPDWQTLERDVRSRQAAEFPLLLQERIAGPGVGVFACCRGGQAVAWFSHRRLREKPPSGGVSVLSESVELRADVKRHAAALLQALAWDGVAMVEFKMDRRDGVPRLMEINGRFWGSLQLAIDAGVDFPAILLRALVQNEPIVPPPYRTGVRNRWWWGDVDALLMRLKASRPDERRRALREFCHVFGRDLHYENPKWSDLRPWFRETARWVRGA